MLNQVLGAASSGRRVAIQNPETRRRDASAPGRFMESFDDFKSRNGAMNRAKAGASSTHSKRWRTAAAFPQLREAFGVRGACSRFWFMEIVHGFFDRALQPEPPKHRSADLLIGPLRFDAGIRPIRRSALPGPVRFRQSATEVRAPLQLAAGFAALKQGSAAKNHRSSPAQALARLALKV